MLPLKFEDRATAFAAAFASRFAIGVLAATTQMPLPAWTRGLLVGLLISIPDAIITKAYVPILASGSETTWRMPSAVLDVEPIDSAATKSLVHTLR